MREDIKWGIRRPQNFYVGGAPSHKGGVRNFEKGDLPCKVLRGASFSDFMGGVSSLRICGKKRCEVGAHLGIFKNLRKKKGVK